MIVYLHEVLGNMTRELLGCTFYKIIEAGSSNSLNKTVDFTDLLSLIFLILNLHPVPRARSIYLKVRKGCRTPRFPQTYHFLHCSAHLTLEGATSRFRILTSL